MRLCVPVLVFLKFVFCADLNLRLVHTNDLLFQFDEFGADYGDCVSQATTVATTVTVTASTAATTVTASTAALTTTVETTTAPPTTTSTITTTVVTDSSTMASVTNSVSTEGGINGSSTMVSVTDSVSTGDVNETLNRRTTSTSDKSEENGRSLRETGACFGGVSRLVSKVNELKNDSAYETLFISSGGILGGEGWFRYLKSQAAVDVTKQFLKPDVVVPSSLDFKAGFIETLNFLNGIQDDVSVLCSNLWFTDDSGANTTFKPYRVFNKTGAPSFAVIGFISTDVTEFLPEKVFVRDEIEVIGELISEIQEKGTHIIIVAGSPTISHAKNILTRFKEIDVIISGGDESYFMYNTADGAPIDKPDETYPYSVKGQAGYQHAVQVPPRGKYVGNLMLKFANGQINETVKTSNPILLDENVTPDINTLQYVTEKRLEVTQVSEEHVGNTVSALSAMNCTENECTAGNLISFAVLQYLTFNDADLKTGASLSLWRSEHMRGSIEKGQITMAQLLDVYPHDTVIGYAKITGAALKTVFEISWENQNSGNFLQFYGAKVVFELARPQGSRVKEVSVLKDGANGLYYTPVADAEEITIAVDAVTLGSNMYEEVFMGKRKYLQFYNSTSSTYHSSLAALQSVLDPKLTTTIVDEGRISFYVAPATPPGANYTGTVFLTIFITLLVQVLAYIGYIYVLPKLRERRGSMVSLIR